MTDGSLMSKTEQKKVIAKMLKERPPTTATLETGMLNIYRWSGKALPHWFIVLQSHATRVHCLVPKRLARAAYFHDAEEIYTSDIPAPIKALFPNVRTFCNLVRREIFKRLKIKWPSKRDWALITKADLTDRDTEIKYLTENNLWLK